MDKLFFVPLIEGMGLGGGEEIFEVARRTSGMGFDGIIDFGDRLLTGLYGSHAVAGSLA